MESEVLFGHDYDKISAYLDEHPLDVNIKGNNNNETPLYFAADCEAIDILDLLIAKGANVNEVNTEKNETALFIASRRNNIDIVLSLLRENADANIRNNSGEIPIMVGAINYELDIVKILTPYSDLRIVNNRRENVLFYAVWSSVEMVSYFLNFGMDINTVNNDFDSLLHEAVRLPISEIKDIVKLLLASGIDTNLTNSQGITAKEYVREPHISDLFP